MLSIEECRKILAPKEYTDEEIEMLRDSCYQLASIMLDVYLTNKKRGHADKDSAIPNRSHKDFT